MTDTKPTVHYRDRGYVDWRPDLRAWVTAQWMEGRKSSWIAAQLGLTKNQIIGRIHDWGLPKRGAIPNARLKNPNFPWRAIEDQMRAGRSIATLAWEYEVNEQTIRSHCKRAGIPTAGNRTEKSVRPMLDRVRPKTAQIPLPPSTLPQEPPVTIADVRQPALFSANVVRLPGTGIRTCQYIAGEWVRGRETPEFCGKPVTMGLSWCAACRGKVFARPGSVAA